MPKPSRLHAFTGILAAIAVSRRAAANGEYVGSRRRLAQRLDGLRQLTRGRGSAVARPLLWRGIRVRVGARAVP
jgi:hypothetical protein